jgi:hypothetical protein
MDIAPIMNIMSSNVLLALRALLPELLSCQDPLVQLR